MAEQVRHQRLLLSLRQSVLQVQEKLTARMVRPLRPGDLNLALRRGNWTFWGEPSDRIALADERLYRAKEEGRNRLYFD
jgi:GGDEF domain-containing protein